MYNDDEIAILIRNRIEELEKERFYTKMELNLIQLKLVKDHVLTKFVL